MPGDALVISGKLAKVYFTLLRHGRPLGVRELQRLAGLSSSGSARHYLEKLVELGLAERGPDGYVAKVNSDSLMSMFIGLLGSIVPRLIPYAVFSTALLAAYVALARPPLDAVVVMAFPTVFLWLEGVRLAVLARKLASS